MGSRIVLISAGNAASCYNSLIDAVNTPALKGANIVINEIDVELLETLTDVAEKMNEEMGAGLEIQGIIDRKEALRDADFIVLNIAVDRMRRWRMDWEIPFKYGIKQVTGENGGPGGLFHTLRMVPPVLDICRDIESLSPDALLLNYSDPVPRICLAISKYTGVKSVGLSHEAAHQVKRLAPIIGVPTKLLESTSAGLNQLSWFKELKLINGDDAYPLLESGLRNTKGFQPLCRALHKRFGLYPSSDDNHVGEFLAYAWEAYPPETRGLEWINKIERGEQATRDMINHFKERKRKLNIEGKLSGEAAMRLIAGIVSNSGHTEPQVNLPNEGQITNLLPDAVVETPALIDGGGVHSTFIGSLPTGIAAICNIQILLQRLVVDAAIHGDIGKAKQAILADPVVQDNEAAKYAFKELFEAHNDLLPQFRKG